MNPITFKYFIKLGTSSSITTTYYGAWFYNSDADTTVVYQIKNMQNMVDYSTTREEKYARSTELTNWTVMTNVPGGLSKGRYAQAIYADSIITDFVSYPSSVNTFNVSTNSSSYPWYTSHDAVNWTQQTDVPVSANARTIMYVKNLSVANQANVKVTLNSLYSFGDDVISSAIITDGMNTTYGASGKVSHDRGVTWQTPSNFQVLTESYPSRFLKYGYYLDKYGTIGGLLSADAGTVRVSDTSEPYAVWHGSRSILGINNAEYARPSIGMPTTEFNPNNINTTSINPLDYNPVAYHETSTMKVVADSYGRLMYTTDDWATKTLEDGLYDEGISRGAGIVQFIGGTGNNQFVIFCSGIIAKTTDGWASWTWDTTTLPVKFLTVLPQWNQNGATRPTYVCCTQLEDNLFAFAWSFYAVFYTTDNGTTWAHASTSTVGQVYQIFKAPSTPDVYITTNNGVYSLRSNAGVWATTVSTVVCNTFSARYFNFYNAADNAYYFMISGNAGYKHTANANGTLSAAAGTYATLTGFTGDTNVSTISSAVTNGGRVISYGNGFYSYTHPKYNTVQIIDSVNKTGKTFLMSKTISTLGTSASATQIGGGLTATIAAGDTTNIRVFGDFWSSAYTTNGGTTWTQDNQYQTEVGITTIPSIELKYEKDFTGSLPSTISMNTYGTGYTSDPTITISAPTGPNPVQAEVYSISRSSGSVYSFTLKNVGNGYLTPPTITVTGGGGTGAAVTTPVQPVKYISYVTINDPDNLLKNPYDYFFIFAIAPAQGSRIVASAAGVEYATTGTGDARTAFTARRYAGYLITPRYGQPNAGTNPTPDLSKIIAVDNTSITDLNGGYSPESGVLSDVSFSRNTGKRIFIYDRDAAGGDVVKYKHPDDFFTNLPAYSIINPIYRDQNGMSGGLVDTSPYNIDPYMSLSSITSMEAANQYDSNKTNFVTISRSTSDGVNLTANWEFWTATYDNVADTITLRDKIYDIVTTHPASEFTTQQPGFNQSEVQPYFMAGGAKATPSTLATTWCVAKFNRSLVQYNFVVLNFEIKITTDSGATFTTVTGYPVDGVLPTWNDNEQKWIVYDSTNRIFYYATDINGPWTSVPSPTGI